MAERSRFWLRALGASIVGAVILITGVAFVPLANIGVQTATGHRLTLREIAVGRKRRIVRVRLP